MPTPEEIALYRKIAKLRHCKTTYNKNIDLMYDADGNPTKLRQDINKILYKIANGELRESFLSGINSEIKYVREQTKKANKKKKKKNKKARTQEQMTAALLKGVQKMYYDAETANRRKYLGAIGLRPKQIHQRNKKALPYYRD